ncbi:hypothetical protein UlMin_046280 [Ulmus minor]
MSGLSTWRYLHLLLCLLIPTFSVVAKICYNYYCHFRWHPMHNCLCLPFKTLERLWGENYFDPTTKKWTDKNTGSATCMCDFTWLPASTVLVEMMIFHLPSPTTAQKYYVENLLGTHLMINMQLPSRIAIPKLFAFVRMYASKVSTGLKVRIMGPIFFPRKNKYLNTKSETVEDVLFGNTIALVGLDQYITKNTIVTNKKEVDAHPVKAMEFSCNVAYDLPKLVEGLKLLDKYDLMVVYTIEKSGKHTLVDDFMGGAEIIKSDPIVSFTKTVLEKSCRTEGLAEGIDDGRIVPRDDRKVSSKIPSKELSWDKDLAKKIWCFGLVTTGPNMVVDMCKGWASKEGALIEENMRGIYFEVCDVALHADAIHRVGGQVIPNARRVLGGIYSVLNQKCENVCEEMQRPGTPLYNMMVYLLVIKSFRFSSTLRADMMSLDPLEVGSQAATLVSETRKIKGLKEQMTPLSEFEDKL